VKFGNKTSGKINFEEGAVNWRILLKLIFKNRG
jgi:hypothetical protein